MGTWSTSLSANDLYVDIHFEFIDLYNEGYSVKDISEKLVRENKEIFEDPGDGHNFWFALAKAQWECKELDPDVLARVTKIIESKNDINVWRQLGARGADLRRRQLALDAFLHSLSTERPKARARRKKSKKVHSPLYHKGDCLSFKFSNGHYGGVIVLEEIPSTIEEGPYNLLAYTDINLQRLPTLRDFKRSNILHDKCEDFDPETSETIWRDYTKLYWAVSVYPRDKEDFTVLIGTIHVRKKYDVRNYESRIMYGYQFNEYDVARIEELLNSEQGQAKHARTKASKFVGSFFRNR